MYNKKSFPGPAAFFAAGPENYIFYNFSNRQTDVIDRKDAHKYSQITGIKPDEIHLTDLLDLKDSSWEILKYEKLLSYLKKEKLLIPLQEIQNTDKNYNHSEYEISLITYERPQLLSNSLESIAKGVKKSNPDIPITVFDDSEKNESKKKNRRLAAEIENKYKVKTYFFGKKEKIIFIEALLPEVERYGVSKRLLFFALFGNQKYSFMKGPGGNRNASLLKLSGRKIISFDDDVKYLFASPISVNNDLEISYTKNPDKNIFPDMIKVINNFKYTEIDALTYINEVLGKTVKALIINAEKSNGSIISDGFRPEPGFSVENDDSTVKAAVFGIYGGRWYNSPFGFLFADGTERKKIFEKKSDYNRIIENPFHLMLPKSLTLSRAASFIATAMGMDAEEILPPFPPYGRNQDGIWAAVMLALNRKSFISQLPLAIYHEVSSKKPFTNKDYEDTSASFGIITVLIIEHIKKNLLSIFPEISYETLGNQFIFLSKLTDKDFLSLCNDLWLEYTGNLFERLENLLVKYKRKPKYWRKDTEKYSTLLKNQALNPVNSIPKELRENYSIEKSIKLYKIFFNDYGELIINWPVIWEKACKLNKKKDNMF